MIGQYFKHLPEVGSTNDELLLNAEVLPEGAIMLADCQNAGRGQNGRVWQAEAGKHLTFSVLLKPAFLEATNLYFLNMVIALAIADAIQACSNLGVQLKWPNDLFASGRKLGGILIETHLQGAFVRHAVLGIGINLNEAMSAKSGMRAIALSELLDAEVDPIKMLQFVSESLEKRYLDFQQRGFGNVLMEYQRKLLGYQELRWFVLPDGVRFEGMIMGVDSSGKLLVRHDGRLSAYAHGEVKMLFEDEVAAD